MKNAIRRKWTPVEDNILTRMYDAGFPDEQISKILDRSEPAIAARHSKIAGVRRYAKRKYTQEPQIRIDLPDEKYRAPANRERYFGEAIQATGKDFATAYGGGNETGTIY